MQPSTITSPGNPAALRPIHLGDRRYRASVARVSPDHLRADLTDLHERCMLAVSLGSQTFEGAKLEATIEWIAENFKRCAVLVADSIYRLTLQVTRDLPAESSREVALQMGREFVDTYRPLFEQHSACHFEFVLFSDIEATPDFKAYFAGFVEFYQTDADFRTSVEGFSQLYLERGGKLDEEEIREVVWLKRQMATLYLLEESAVFALMNRDGWPVLVYPGSIRTFQDIAEGLFPGVPEHLKSLVFVSLRLNRTGLYYDDHAVRQIRRSAISDNGRGLTAAWTEDWWDIVTSKGHKYTTRRVFRQRDTLLECGQPDDGAVYLLLEGSVEIDLPSLGGDIKQQVAILEAGSVFGEQAFLDGLPRTASVIARTDGRACMLSREGFERLRVDHPQLACSLLAYLGKVQSVRKRKYTEEARALIG